jgi:hypothetical protein
MGKCCLKIESLENQFFYPDPRGSKLIFFAPLGAGVKEENQWAILLIAEFQLFKQLLG